MELDSWTKFGTVCGLISVVLDAALSLFVTSRILWWQVTPWLPIPTPTPVYVWSVVAILLIIVLPVLVLLVIALKAIQYSVASYILEYLGFQGSGLRAVVATAVMGSVLFTSIATIFSLTKNVLVSYVVGVESEVAIATLAFYVYRYLGWEVPSYKQS